MLRPGIIKKLCDKKHITPYALAKKAEISMTYSYRLYHGKMINPSTRILDQVAWGLNVTTKDLII
ncbi:MAG: helix-turn-helix transcriptional regulator [Bacilli bacterium]